MRTAVQRQFRAMSPINPPQIKTIAAWFKGFIETGSVVHGERGQLRRGVSGDVYRVRRSYEISLRKSTATLAK
jgi:hypothetical protein